MMQEYRDFKEFIELLNKHNVRYLIVGGYALGYHSRPKFTQDIDFWIKSDTTNAKKILNVLRDFGFAQLEITSDDLTEPGKIIQLGNAPLRIDLLTSIDGLQFKEAYQNRVTADYFGVQTFILSLDDLIKNKEVSGRKKDLQDIEWIKQYSNR